MWQLTRASVRYHRSGFVGAAVATCLATVLLTALGVLLESGLRGGVAPGRYAAADIVIGAPQELAVAGDSSEAFPERAGLPLEIVASIASIPGVERAVGDVAVELHTDDQRTVTAHGWGSAVLTPFTLVTGVAPTEPEQVVVDESFGLPVGSTIGLSHGGIRTTYTVVGSAQRSGWPNPESSHRTRASVFFTDDHARQFRPDPDRIETVGVIVDAGEDPRRVASMIADVVPGIETYLGDDRGNAESLASFGARTQLIALSSSFAGVAVLIAIFVVASTLSLSITQRRRSFALLRSIGTTPGQIQKMVASEVGLVAGGAALAGVVPGLLLAGVLRANFATARLIPEEFELVYGIVPPISAVVLAVGAALLAAWMAARRTARLDPSAGLRESAAGTARMGRVRTASAVVLSLGGIGASLAPLAVPGTIGIAAAGAGSLLLIVAVGLGGPSIVRTALDRVGRRLAQSSSASAVLAAANVRGEARRTAGSVVPVALAVGLGCVQLMMPATVATVAAAQTRDGLIADFLVTAQGEGIAPGFVEQLAAIPGVDQVNPIVRSTALFSDTIFGEGAMVQRFALQGVDPHAVRGTVDLDALSGSIDRLVEPGTVALSRDAASLVGVRVGDSVTFHLGDGTLVTADVVAIYGRGLGFGDVTMSSSLVREHTTSGLYEHLLVSAPAVNAVSFRQLVSSLGLIIVENETLTAAGSEDRKTQSWVSNLALAIILGYVALSVANSLVMTTSERRREFGLLRRVGMTDRQVRSMMRIESALVAALAILVGTLIAVPPLVGTALGVSGQPMPTVPLATYLGIVATAATICTTSIGVSTRVALRSTAPAGG